MPNITDQLANVTNSTELRDIFFKAENATIQKEILTLGKDKVQSLIVNIAGLIAFLHDAKDTSIQKLLLNLLGEQKIRDLIESFRSLVLDVFPHATDTDVQKHVLDLLGKQKVQDLIEKDTGTLSLSDFYIIKDETTRVHLYGLFEAAKQKHQSQSLSGNFSGGAPSCTFFSTQQQLCGTNKTTPQQLDEKKSDETSQTTVEFR